MLNMQEIEYPLRLCVELLYFAGLGACGKTENMRASEIKEAVSVFFSDDQIQEAICILAG